MEKAEGTIALRTAGFIISLILSLVAYWVMVNPEYFNLEPSKAILGIFVLAISQAIAQLIFFLNVWREKGILWNLIFFISTMTIVFIVIFFTIWVIDNLNYRMMPPM